MNLEELKNVDLLTLENEKEHLNSVLELETEELKDYLMYAIDTFYKTDEEGENSEVVERFFNEEKFKPYYKEMMESDVDESEEISED